ncbi:sulfite exporter TauE/SafE family protein [Leekyejoonella antrihumi]|uniref:Probable membrane transporter protein n=2 Tax=Leekyejoonella antrihumi TaxID=1660198 RepID=A0A563E2J3_9MICO|nr:sulfite exporter TauE/SafE family protein [Leekyejoonella antrihumi]
MMGLTLLVAGFVQGSTGFGFALISGPVIGLVQPLLLPVILLIEAIPLNSYVAWRERHHLDRTGAKWTSAGRLVGTFGGLWVLLAVTERQLSVLIGVCTVLAVLATLCVPAFAPGRRAFVIAGLITGVTETSTGIGGPPLAVVYQHRAAPVVRSTVSVIFVIGELISLVILAVSGKVSEHQVSTAILLLPAALVGAYASRFAHHRLEGPAMRYTVLGFALVSGVVVAAQAL